MTTLLKTFYRILLWAVVLCFIGSPAGKICVLIVALLFLYFVARVIITLILWLLIAAVFVLFLLLILL